MFARDGGFLKFDLMPRGGGIMGLSAFTLGDKFSMLKLINCVYSKKLWDSRMFNSPRILDDEYFAHMRNTTSWISLWHLTTSTWNQMCTSGTVEHNDKALLKLNRNAFISVDASGGLGSYVSLWLRRCNAWKAEKGTASDATCVKVIQSGNLTIFYRFVWKTAKQWVDER